MDIKMTRREVREVTFMVPFQTEFRLDVSIDDTISQYYTMESRDMDAADENVSAVKLSPADRQYIEAVVDGVKEYKNELDQIISGFSRGWTIERLIKVDVAILRYCIYEMKYMADKTPPEVSINEAVEIAKIWNHI